MFNRKTEFHSGSDPAEDGATVCEAPAPVKGIRGNRYADRQVTRLPRHPLAFDVGEHPSHSNANNDVPSPMLWTGANECGNPVFGVAASAVGAGAVEIAALAGRPDGSYKSVRRSLTPHEARQLALHLMAAADEAERLEALQLVATA